MRGQGYLKQKDCSVNPELWVQGNPPNRRQSFEVEVMCVAGLSLLAPCLVVVMINVLLFRSNSGSLFEFPCLTLPYGSVATETSPEPSGGRTPGQARSVSRGSQLVTTLGICTGPPYGRVIAKCASSTWHIWLLLC